MSNPPWRNTRPSSPYGGEPAARPRDRDPRVPDEDPRATVRGPRRRDPGNSTGQIPANSPTRGGDLWSDAPTRRMPAQSSATQPVRVQAGGREQRGNRRPGSREPQLSRNGGALRGLPLGGTLSGGLGVAILAASTALGASATMLTGREPGSILGIFVIIGTVAAAVAVRPQAGRLIIPVPALSYLVAAMVTGVIYDHSADASKTALAIDAAQWIANGFFAMVLATVLAIVLVTARWLLWRRQRPGSPATRASAGPPAKQERPAPLPQPVVDDYWNQAPYGNQESRGSGPRPGQQQWPPRTDPRQGRPAGPGPYNFSSGA
jgi:hypothetical protein